MILEVYINSSIPSIDLESKSQTAKHSKTKYNNLILKSSTRKPKNLYYLKMFTSKFLVYILATAMTL